MEIYNCGKRMKEGLFSCLERIYAAIWRIVVFSERENVCSFVTRTARRKEN